MNKKTGKIPGQSGYGRPPVSGQFKKGQSGNPKGRPKGARNKPQTELVKLTDVIAQEAERQIPMGPHGEVVSAKQAATRAILFKAIKGGPHAQRHAMQLIQQAEQAQGHAARAPVELYSHIKTSLTQAELYAQAQGVPLPKELCPADRVRFDVGRGEVVIGHPVGAREERRWDALWALKYAFLQEIALLTEDQADPRCGGTAEDDLEALLQAHERMLEQLNSVLEQIWGARPEDMFGAPEDMGAVHVALRALEGQPEWGEALHQFGLLQDMRRALEVRADKRTAENAAMHGLGAYSG